MSPREPRSDVPTRAASPLGLAREAGRRWLCFEAALLVTLLPAWLGLSWLPALMRWPRFFELAWAWQILATVPGGLVRPGAGGEAGEAWLPDAAPLLALGFWAAAGLALALGLRRLGFRVYALLCLPLVFATGMLAWLLLRAFGLAPYAGV